MTPSSVLEREVKFYAGIAEDWKQDHADAMACMNLQEILSFGNWIYDRICEADERWREDVAKRTRSYDVAEAKKIRALFGWWLAPCARVEDLIQSFEHQGYDVAAAAEFRKRRAECEWSLKPADQAFDHPRMVELRDQAIDDLRRGVTEAV